mmetsp:Transcript_18996/g.57387  ORF Transcript_18996/g.57387 Transcript_18996/m.57387 type:complete len:1080 (-) Transcript_18996:272-3511(-)|eukprot:CAMPEP_0206137822 /NCGR_PEP_ID=MMETSP1473-20131121/2873_1 /ASSEMBLY_ACC=CAM_ASM_001109 /TAXON_ID=1461547 /ORGANISM="Stichococcus sp, Strain RCC1054" /LENGTH=1079 /DNA_ID=CAMNT_0053531073 /DNA_START=326 /DNA_END=3565 /DNA_ORIENTATION=-
MNTVATDTRYSQQQWAGQPVTAQAQHANGAAHMGAPHQQQHSQSQQQTLPQQRRGKSLTDPDVPAGNNGWDNVNSDLIMHVDDVLLGSDGSQYLVRGLLGQGTFGQVFECTQLSPTGATDTVAVKVIKNQTAYFQQARVEVGVLQLLNNRADADDSHHIVRMREFFVFQAHLCLVFELLSVNLYELIKHNQFRGLSMNLLRLFMTQILDALAVLQAEGIIHCDLKPENVLLKGVETGDIKVIDFGSACLENQTVYSYIQSRFYRSPEVVLGYQYTMAIDMWSLGCVAAELFLGLPLFPGASEHDLLSRITEMLGPPPPGVLASSKNAEKYFTVVDSVVQTPQGPRLQPSVQLRTRDEFEASTGTKAPAGKRYFKHRHLPDIINEYPFRSDLSESEIEGEKSLREALVDFLLGVLDLNPDTRWTPRQALHHPFITGGIFHGPYQPAPDPRGLPMRRASFSTAALAAPVAGAASYSATPSWNTLIGPASMSGRAHMLATSPEAAHAAAHAAAMQSMAAGYSASESIAAAYGLPSNTPSHITLPLLQQFQQSMMSQQQGPGKQYGFQSPPRAEGGPHDAASPQIAAMQLAGPQPLDMAGRASSPALAIARPDASMELYPNSPRRQQRATGTSRLSSGKLPQLAASQLRHQWASQQASGSLGGAGLHGSPAKRTTSMDLAASLWPSGGAAISAPARRSSFTGQGASYAAGGGVFSGHQPLPSSATLPNGSAAVPLFHHQQQQQQQQFRQQAPQQQMPFSSSPAGVLPHPLSLAPSQSLPGEHLPHWQQQQQASQLLRMPSGGGGGALGGAGLGSNEYLNQLGVGALGGAPQQTHPAARGASGELSEDLLFSEEGVLGEGARRLSMDRSASGGLHRLSSTSLGAAGYPAGRSLLGHIAEDASTTGSAATSLDLRQPALAWPRDGKPDPPSGPLGRPLHDHRFGGGALPLHHPAARPDHQQQQLPQQQQPPQTQHLLHALQHSYAADQSNLSQQSDGLGGPYGGAHQYGGAPEQQHAPWGGRGPRDGLYAVPVHSSIADNAPLDARQVGNALQQLQPDMSALFGPSAAAPLLPAQDGVGRFQGLG